MSLSCPSSRQIKRWLLYAVALVVVSAAVVLSVSRVLISNVESYRVDIENLASAYLAHAVKIESIDARISGLKPVLVFNQVRLMDKTGQREIVSFSEAEVSLDIYQSWRQQQLVPSEIVIAGIELAVTRLSNDTILIQDLEIDSLATQQESDIRDEFDLTDWLFQHSHLAIKDSVVIWKDQKTGLQSLRFDDVNLQLQNNERQHTLSGKIALPRQVGKKFEIAISIDGNVRLPTTWQGQLFLRADDVNLHHLGNYLEFEKTTIHNGRGDFALWADINKGRVEHFSADVALHSLDLEAPYLRQRTRMDLLSGLFDFANHKAGWSLAIDRFQLVDTGIVWPVTRLGIRQEDANESGPASLKLTAAYFRLQDISRLLVATTLLPTDINSWLRQASPSGDVINLQLQTLLETDAPVYEAQAQIHKLSLHKTDSSPGIRALDIAVWANETHGQATVSAQKSEIDMPALFRKPLPLDQFSAMAAWQMEAEGWQVRVDDIRVVNRDLAVQGQLKIDLPEKAAMFLDLQIHANKVNSANKNRYLPVHIMDKDLVAWLEKADMQGTVNSTDVVFHGRVDRFPYVKPSGQFMVEFSSDDLAIEYLPGWPGIRQAAVSAHFDSRGVRIDIRKGKILQTRLTPSRVRIADYTNPVLDIEGQASGPLGDVFHFVSHSPVLPKSKKTVARLRIKGSAKTRIKVQMPLADNTRKIMDLNYAGSVEVDKGAIDVWNGKLQVDRLKGKLTFDKQGEQARNVSGRLYGYDALFDIITRKVGETPVVSLTARSRLDMGKVLKKAALPGAEHFTGLSDWQGVWTPGYRHKGRDIPTSLTLISNLQGMAVQLPAPLNKVAGKEKEFSINMQFVDDVRTRIKLQYNNDVTSIMDISDGQLQKMAMHFGLGQVKLPDDDLIRLTGSTSELNISRWQALIRELTPGFRSDRPPLPVELDMTRLVLVSEKDGSGKPAQQSVRPRDVPLFSGVVRQLSYNGTQFGKMQILTRRTRRGIQLETLKLVSPLHTVEARGHWSSGLLGNVSQLEFDVSSPDAGRMMDNLGYSVVIKGGQLKMNGTLGWSASPFGVSLENIMGKLHLELKDGVITNIDAGAGRLLGLFSLSALPRRLALDFKDTFDEGFSFDRITGDMELKEGNAFTENLQTTSPVADITVTGRTGYVKQDFDQVITVIPELGGTLPIAGGLIFGLQVGALIALLDTVMGSELDKANMRQYHVGGSWEKPVITVLKSPEEFPLYEEDEE